MATGVDLDALEAALAQMTKGPLVVAEYVSETGYVDDYLRTIQAPEVSVASELYPCDATGLVALVNAAPELLRLARLGQDHVEAVEAAYREAAVLFGFNPNDLERWWLASDARKRLKETT